MELKFVFAIASVVIGTYSFIPYIRDIFLRKTQPHIYTWLVWTITQGTAALSIWYGGGGIGAAELIVGTIIMCAITILSFKFGTKNITKVDTLLLIVTLLAIVIWWQLKNPTLTVVMICIIDLLGYFPSYRKSFEEPWSETLITWVSFIIGNIFALLALQEYNFLTVSFLIVISAANLLLLIICIMRRAVVKKPLT